MQRVTPQQMEYWNTHRCWNCGKHSFSQKILPLISKCGGFLCLKCYADLFGTPPK